MTVTYSGGRKEYGWAGGRREEEVGEEHKADNKLETETCVTSGADQQNYISRDAACSASRSATKNRVPPSRSRRRIAARHSNPQS